jgi:hypothetical protein
MTPHYRPPIPAVDDSVNAITRAVASGSAPMQPLPPTHRATSAREGGVLAVASPERTPPATGNNRYRCWRGGGGAVI